MSVIVITYRIAGMFGSGKVWRICEASVIQQTSQILSLWSKFIHLPNFFIANYFGNAPNINPAKHSHFMVIVSSNFILADYDYFLLRSFSQEKLQAGVPGRIYDILTRSIRMRIHTTIRLQISMTKYFRNLCEFDNRYKYFCSKTFLMAA